MVVVLIHSMQSLFFENVPNPASYCLFSFLSRDKYSTNLTRNDESLDGILGTQTRGGSMVGANETTELLRHPHLMQSLWSFCFFGGLNKCIKETSWLAEPWSSSDKGESLACLITSPFNKNRLFCKAILLMFF